MSFSRRKRFCTTVLSLTLLAQAGCATHPDSVSARYVSPHSYNAYDCSQLQDEKARLSNEVARVAGLQRENANGDAALLTVGLIIFWPALIGMAATKDRKDELGRMKGEYEAVESQIRLKGCGLIVSPAPAAPAQPASPQPQRQQFQAAQASGARPAQDARVTQPQNPNELRYQCPPPGTYVETQTDSQILSRTHLGSIPDKPGGCLARRGSEVSESYFGFYFGSLTRGVEEARQGLSDLFADRRQSFTVTAGDARIEYNETWRRLGKETVSIDSKPTETVVFERDQVGAAGNSFSGTERLWFSPETNVWVKRQVIRKNGGSWGSDWEVKRIVGS